MGKSYIHQNNAPASFALSVQEFLTKCSVYPHYSYFPHNAVQLVSLCKTQTCKVHTAI